MHHEIDSDSGVSVLLHCFGGGVCRGLGVIAVRMKRGSAYGSVTVSQFLATPLKGSKEEYDYLGSVDQACVKSIFPHGGDQPCWWLERHTKQWQ